MLAAGIDIGGTNITAAAVGADHEVVDRRKVDTSVDGPAAVARQVGDLVRELGGEVGPVGVGVPGPVRGGVVSRAPNLAGWAHDVDLGGLLHEALGRPVVVGNDANLGTYGETVAGAARGAAFALGVWLGTGVGGGLVLDGELHTGSVGAAGEFGHMIVHQGGAMCGCGRRGCVEAYAGRASLARAVDLALAAGWRTSLIEHRDRKGKDRLTAGVWAAALADGDQLANRLWGDAVEAIGVGVSAVVNLLDVDRVILGGGMAEKLGQPLADAVMAQARPRILAVRPEHEVVVAELGDDAGVVGAAALARRQAELDDR